MMMMMMTMTIFIIMMMMNIKMMIIIMIMMMMMMMIINMIIMMMYQVVYEPRCKSRDASPTKPVGSRAQSRAGGRKLSRARTPSVKMERLVRAMSQPATPSPSLHPLLQLGEDCEIMDSQELDSDKMRRIRELEDNVRIQEEVVIDLKGKLSNGHESIEEEEGSW